MTLRNDNLLDTFPPGFSSHRYRATPEEIERNRRENQIQREREEQAWKELIEEGKIRPEPHEETP